MGQSPSGLAKRAAENTRGARHSDLMGFLKNLMVERDLVTKERNAAIELLPQTARLREIADAEDVIEGVLEDLRHSCSHSGLHTTDEDESVWCADCGALVA